MMRESAGSLGLALCPDCHCLCHMPPLKRGQRALCPRCGQRLWLRHPRAVNRTWALLTAGALMLIPANTLTMMTLTYLGSPVPDTIFSGVMRLANSGLWGIAAIVFIASIFVPVFKLVGLVLLQLAIQYRWRLNPTQCTLMYRFIHFVGRWSMLDLFVIAILVALVDLGNLADVTVGPAASAFAAAVVITMIAANTFDARLLWDLVDERDNQ